jgi:DNA mismatch endonuclease (patch repair protein)
MRANPRTGTRPEQRLRCALHRAGLRFRKDFPIVTPERRVRPDIVFTRARLAVFVDGCFWHRCPQHGNVPRANTRYWAPKLERNVLRDREVDRALTVCGWRVLRIWEHEPLDEATRRVFAQLDALAELSSVERASVGFS